MDDNKKNQNVGATPEAKKIENEKPVGEYKPKTNETAAKDK
jgi:hypothetical protein